MESPLSSSSLLAEILNNIEIGVLIHDDSGKVVQFNSSTVSILCLTEDQLSGKTPKDPGWQTIKPDGTPFPEDEHPSKISLKTGKSLINVLMGIKPPYGGIKWASINSQVVMLEGAKFVYTTFKEITSSIDFQNNLNAIISSLDDVVYEIDEYGTILNIWANNEEKVCFPVNNMIGKKIVDFVPGHNQKAFSEKIKTTIDSENPAELTFHSTCRRDEEKWYLAKFRISDPIKKRLTIFVSDITEHKKAREEIEVLKDRLILAARAGGVGLWSWDLVNNELHWDDKMYELYGVKKKNFISIYDTWKKCVHEDDIDWIENEIRLAVEGKKDFSAKFRIKWPNGKIHIVKAAAILLKDELGSPIRMIGTTWDVTEEVELENALKESEEKFRSSFNNASPGMTITNLDGNWIEVNEAFSQMLGYPKEDLLKMNFADVTHEDDLKKDLGGIKSMISGERENYTTEKRYIHKDGHVVWASLSASLVKNEDGSPKFFIAHMTDISRRKILFNELETKNKILRSTTLDLENKIAQLEEFNSIIAHNVRGPAANLVQLCELFESPGGEEKKHKLLSMVKATSLSILDTLNDLKEIVEIRMSRDVPFEDCHFDEVISRVEQLLKAELISKKVKLVKELKAIHVKYPRAYLENILYNLISNSIKYGKQGVPPIVRISTYDTEERTFLSVSDNGIGIDLSNFGDQIFNYKKTFHEGYDSTGLGLYIVKNQVAAFGGSIAVDSEPGKGSTFTVSFKKK